MLDEWEQEQYEMWDVEEDVYDDDGYGYDDYDYGYEDYEPNPYDGTYSEM